MSETEVVSYDVRDRIALVTITNGKANALSHDVINGIGDALTRAEASGDDVGAIVITATPGMFSGVASS